MKKWKCIVCGYVYDEAIGISRGGPCARNPLGRRSRGLELPGLRHVKIRFRNDGGLNVPSCSVVIIGTGLAGYGTAREFRKSDPSTPLTLITADEGTYYSKPQLSSALGSGKSPDQLALKDAAAMAKELNARILTYTRVIDADAEGRILKTGSRW